MPVSRIVACMPASVGHLAPVALIGWLKKKFKTNIEFKMHIRRLPSKFNASILILLVRFLRFSSFLMSELLILFVGSHVEGYLRVYQPKIIDKKKVKIINNSIAEKTFSFYSKSNFHGMNLCHWKKTKNLNK